MSRKKSLIKTKTIIILWSCRKSSKKLDNPNRFSTSICRERSWRWWLFSTRSRRKFWVLKKRALCGTGILTDSKLRCPNYSSKSRRWSKKIINCRTYFRAPKTSSRTPSTSFNFRFSRSRSWSKRVIRGFKPSRRATSNSNNRKRWAPWTRPTRSTV